MIEALASGTPVIALDRGSVREVVTHRVSGAICRSIDEMVDACGWIGQLTPENCRNEARRFTASTMAAQYAAIYAEVIGSSSRILITSSHAPPVRWPSERGATSDEPRQHRESA
jgi:glycosyltransferase involved in cell wall biosynthesis